MIDSAVRSILNSFEELSIMLRKVLVISLLGALIASSLPVVAQSLDVKKPAPLQAGINTATVDSMVGPHYWYFYADPGSFSGSLNRLGSPGDVIRAKLGLGVAFAPKLQFSVVSSKDKGDRTNFNGSVKKRDKVIVMVDPGRPGLVRSACNYELQVSGNVSFGDVASAPTIVGTYMAMLNNYGLTKFNEDGTVITALGTKGKWTLFDKDTQTYVVDLDKNRYSLKFISGRGLVDAAQNGLIVFTRER